MRKIIPFAITIFSLTAAFIAGYLYFWFIPHTIERQVIQNFDKLGFEKLAYHSKAHGGGKLVFKDISVDSDDFSKIESITVKYSLLGYLTNDHRAQSLIVKNLKLTGELDQNGDAVISGWDQNKSLVSILAIIPAETIIFENASIDLLSHSLGGITLKSDIQITNSPNKAAKIRGRVRSEQKKLNFDAQIEGLLSSKGNIDIKAEIQQIQILTSVYEIRRFNADLLLKKEPKKPMNISVEGTAGSVLWNKMPLGEVNINYESSADNFNIFAEGQTIGLEKIEFSSQINHVDKLTHYETTITPSQTTDLIAYLRTHKIISNDPELPSYILGIKQPIFTVETRINPDTPDYDGTLKLLSSQPNFEINGYYKYQNDKKMLSGHFEIPTTTTTLEFGSSTPINSELENTNAPENIPENSPFKIDISSQGAFEIENWGTIKSTLAWAYELSSLNGEISYGALKLKNINGKLVHSNKREKNPSELILNYTLPLRDIIPHKGVIILNLLQEKAAFIKKILLNVYSGRLEATELNFDHGHLPQNISLTIEDINLSTLLQDTRIGGINMVGQMGGVLPLTLADNKIMVKGGILQSQGSGIARISSYVSTELFPGYTKEMQKIRDALENFHYEFFEIRLDGDLSSSTMMTLKARGFNPDLADKSYVDINLQLETPVTTLLSNLIEQN